MALDQTSGEVLVPVYSLGPLYDLARRLSRPDWENVDIKDEMFASVLFKAERELRTNAVAQKFTHGHLLAVSTEVISFAVALDGRREYNVHRAPRGLIRQPGWLVGIGCFDSDAAELQTLQKSADNTPWEQTIFLVTQPDLPMSEDDLCNNPGFLIPIRPTSQFSTLRSLDAILNS